MFSYWSTNSADCAVVENLQSVLPEGTRFFGFQEEYSEDEDDSSNESVELYWYYRVLLWPPLDCDPREWQKLADAGVPISLGGSNTIDCIVPLGIKGFAIAQAGRLLLSYLMAQEKIAREKHHHTRWFGELPWKEMFLPFR